MTCSSKFIAAHSKYPPNDFLYTLFCNNIVTTLASIQISTAYDPPFLTMLNTVTMRLQNKGPIAEETVTQLTG